MAQMVDRINLVWMLRYRFNYELPAAQVYYLLVGSGYRLPGDALQRLVTQTSRQGVLDNLPESMARDVQGARTIVEVFVRLEQAARDQARRVLAAAGKPISRAFAYLILREQDLRAVRAVLRGRQLRLATANIEQAIGLEAMREM